MSRFLRIAMAVVVLLMVACDTAADDAGDATTAETTPSSSTTVLPTSRQWWRASRRPAEQMGPVDWAIEPTTMPLDSTLQLSQAVVIGTVEEVAGPFWNEADGQFWRPDGVEDVTLPTLYREVTFSVEEVLYDETATLAAGRSMSVLAGGTGGGVPGVLEGQGPEVQAGDHKLVALWLRAFVFRENAIDVWQPVFGPVGVMDPIGENRWQPQWVDRTFPTFLDVPVPTQRLSADDVVGLLDLVKAEPLQYPGWAAAEHTADRYRQSKGLDSAEPECPNVPRGECSTSTIDALTAEEIRQIYGDGLARLCRSALCADRPLYVSLRPDTPEIRQAILDVKPQAQFIGPDERVGPAGGPVPDRGIILGFQWDPTTDTRRVQIEAGWATTPTTGEGFRYIYQWNGTSWEWYDTAATYMK